MFCPKCRQSYGSEDLERLVPNQSNIGYDVLNFVGKSYHQKSKSHISIQKELNQCNVFLSLREIGYLAKKFIIYLSIAHREAAESLRRQMVSRGGYILHLDGTIGKKGNSPFLISALDGLTGMVLGNAKVSSESLANITPFLELIKGRFGDPIALVHDMGHGLTSAVDHVFPHTPDFICHFHFLRDLGKDLMKTQYQVLSKDVKALRVRTKLREASRKLKLMIEADPHEKACLDRCLDKIPTMERGISMKVSTYLLLMWVLECSASLKGYGLPFDRADMVFFHRLQDASPMIRRWLFTQKNKGSLSRLGYLLKSITNDQRLNGLIAGLDQKARDFDSLRNAMKIALPDGSAGLNDDGDTDESLSTIRLRVNDWLQQPHIHKLAVNDRRYEKAIKQINKYEHRLFADPIQVETSEGVIEIRPQRTNNILERFFRDLKRISRKRNGFISVGSEIRTMVSDTPLVKNLENPEYLKVILGGRNNLAERFSEIDPKKVRDLLNKHQDELCPGSVKLRRLAKIEDLPALLEDLTAAERVA